MDLRESLTSMAQVAPIRSSDFAKSVFIYSRKVPEFIVHII
jgi:hypothetical protein